MDRIPDDDLCTYWNCREDIWAYYCKAAHEAGTNSKTGRPLGYSLEFFFNGQTRLEDQNALVRAFLGDPDARAQLQRLEPPPEDSIRQCTSRVKPLYDEQLRAISRALSYPISVVQGPPGTGKTETILNLISVILNTQPGATIAVVSTNNEALATIAGKLEKRKDTDPIMAAVYEKLARLGSSDNNKKWRDSRRAAGEDVGAFSEGTSQVRVHHSYLARRPVFSSTVHSLRKVFSLDPAFDNQFDYVIADECSQMSIMLGIVAMSCAKNMVLIGDNNQLTPVISRRIRKLESDPDVMDLDVPDLYMETEEKSFLSLCEAVFPAETPNTFLNEHRRCHKSIIEFCNQFVYDGKLEIKTPDDGLDGRFRIRAVWYEGDYCERLSVLRGTESGNGDEDGQASLRRIHYNKRQIEIFLREELPRLLEELRTNPGLSVAVVSPFNYQIELLGVRLKETEDKLRKDLNVRIHDGLQDDDGIPIADIPHLTINKSQGKSYDVIYLLPVEDYYTKTEKPWSQSKRLINVAVSRAKRELCVISSQWLPEALQQALTGYVLPNGAGMESEETRNTFFCRRLLEYVAEHCPEPESGSRFGFHRSGITSVFDLVPYYRCMTGGSYAGNGSDTGAGSLSASAKCVQNALLGTFGDRYTLLRELPLRDLRKETGEVTCTDKTLLRYRQESCIDFALCEETENGGKVKLLIEVDGAEHRDYNPELQKYDEKKDIWVEDYLEAKAILLRIPTDGSMEPEMAQVKRMLDNAGGFSLVIPKDTVRRTRVSRTVSQAQDTVNLLLHRLDRGVDVNLARLREFISRKDLSKEEKINAIRTDYTHPQAMSYKEAPLNNFYLCRYAVAYAFEYAMLYDLALRLCRQSGGATFSAVSFGAGSFLDAWSMAYAKARLTVENPAFDEIKLSYQGVDEQAWHYYFVNPSPADGPTGGQIRELFSELQFHHQDISRFLEDAGECFKPNVLILPKIVNELKDDDVSRLADAMEQLRFPNDEYYLLVSHSDGFKRESTKTLKRLIGAINRDGAFDVCCDCYDLLTPENRSGFEQAWLGNDSLTPLATAQDLPLRLYGFSSAPLDPDEPVANDDSSCYIKNHNPHFCYEAPKEYLRDLGEWSEKIGRTEQVVKVKYMLFDIIRLKRKKT